jgi:uncharacterized SAM-binding protein YcdF (DUF218 family)
MTRPGRGLRRSLVLLILLGAAIGAAFGVPALGEWLVVADALVPSDAIFVLAGRSPAREVEAAALHRRGLAPVVALSRARDPLTLAKQIARLPSGQDVAAGVLTTLGVPAGAILRLDQEVENTAEELDVIAAAARTRGFRRVILVTSPSHTRRVRIIWDARARGVAALVYPTPYETFDGRRWWRSRHGVEAVLHELGGIANFRLGTLLPTFDDGDG